MTLSDKIIKNKTNPTLSNKFTDQENSQSGLNEKNQLDVPVKIIQLLDYETEIFVDIIQEVAWNNTPQIKRNQQEIIIHLKFTTWLKKRKATRTWQNTRTTVN